MPGGACQRDLHYSKMVCMPMHMYVCVVCMYNLFLYTCMYMSVYLYVCTYVHYGWPRGACQRDLHYSKMVCMYKCMYTCMYMSVYFHPCMYVYHGCLEKHAKEICTTPKWYVCINVCIHVCICLYIFIHVCMCIMIA
jgi:hypothetical protein